VARDRLKEYRDARIKKHIYTRLLMVESPLVADEKKEALSKFREVRAIAKELLNPNLQVSLWKNSVAMTIWDQGLHSIIITNKSIAVFMKQLFELAWSQAK
jgi:hypothetical protein